MKYNVLFFCFMCFSFVGFSQHPIILSNVNEFSEGYFGPAKILVKLDPYSRIPLSDFPMDRNFYVRVYFNKTDPYPIEVTVLDGDQSHPDMTLLFVQLDDDTSSKDDDTNLKIYNAIDILMRPLKPDHNYQLVLKYSLNANEMANYIKVLYVIYKDPSHAEQFYRAQQFKNRSQSYTTFKDLKKYYNQRHIEEIFSHAKKAGGVNPSDAAIISAATPEINALANDSKSNFIVISNNKTRTVFLNATAGTDFDAIPYKIENSAPLSLTPDAGVIYAGFQKGFSVVTPYVGVCYSLRPYDSDIKFRQVKKQGLLAWERLSLHLGLTLNSIAKDNYRDNIFGSNNVLTGLGYRFSNVICLTGGILFYNNVDPNPVIDKKTVGVAPYFGISINLKIKTALGDLAKVFSYGK